MTTTPEPLLLIWYPREVTEAPVTRRLLWLGAGALGVFVVAALSLILSLAPVRGPVNRSAEHGPADPRGAFRAGQAVQVWHAGKWYPGRIQSTADEQYFVNYDGFSKSWYEWVDASRLRANE
jgi:hypothetical protein